MVSKSTNAGPALGGVLTDPVSGTPGVRFTLRDATGAVIEDRSPANATTMVGWDDNFSDTVATVDFAAQVTLSGRLEVGGSGVGRWHMEIAGVAENFDNRVTATGLGVETLAPKFHTRVVDVNAGQLLTGSVQLGSPPASGSADDALESASAVGTFDQPVRPPRAQKREQSRFSGGRRRV